MVSCEEKAVVVEENGMASRMAGSGDRGEIRVEFDRGRSFKKSFRPNRTAFMGVDDPVTAKMGVKPLVIGHVIAMGEEHGGHPAQFLDPANQRPGESRRVDQDVTFRTDDQIAGSAEGIP